MLLTGDGVRALSPSLHGKVGILIVPDEPEAKRSNARLRRLEQHNEIRAISCAELDAKMRDGLSERDAILALLAGRNFIVISDCRGEP